MLLFSCLHVEKNYSVLLLCVPCQEITQDCMQLLLRNHLNYLKVRLRQKIKVIHNLETMMFGLFYH